MNLKTQAKTALWANFPNNGFIPATLECPSIAQAVPNYLTTQHQEVDVEVASHLCSTDNNTYP